MFSISHTSQPKPVSADELDKIYTQVLLDSVYNPQSKISLPQADKQASLRNSSCGDEINVQLKLSPDGQKISQVGWQGDGCIISQAHMDGLALVLRDKKVSDVKTWGQAEVLKVFGLPSIAPGRLKCLLLGLTAVQQALAK